LRHETRTTSKTVARRWPDAIREVVIYCDVDASRPFALPVSLLKKNLGPVHELLVEQIFNPYF
jgi:hypothetical protein